MPRQYLVVRHERLHKLAVGLELILVNDLRFAVASRSQTFQIMAHIKLTNAHENLYGAGQRINEALIGINESVLLFFALEFKVYRRHLHHDSVLVMGQHQDAIANAAYINLSTG